MGRALTSGGNVPHSMERIVAFFQKEPTGSEAASFMKKEFGEGGKGVVIDGQEYALWFSQEGFRLAPGRSAFGPGSTLVPWVTAAAQATQLLQDGAFAAQEQIEAARGNEFRELAEALWHLRRDFSDEAKHERLLPSLETAYTTLTFPEGIKAIAELLEKALTRQDIMREMAVFTDRYAADPSLLRFRQRIPPRELFERIYHLFRPIVTFHASEDFIPVRARFITSEEIDQLLRHGSGMAGGKLRIAAYFSQAHMTKERVQFLAKEYGIGGRSYTGFSESHDGKGIQFTRADAYSGAQGYDTVHLTWNQVQKRIGELMEAGQYLDGEEQARLPEYMQKQLNADELEARKLTTPVDELTAMARALTGSGRPQTQEEPSGQISFDMLSAPTAAPSEPALFPEPALSDIVPPSPEPAAHPVILYRQALDMLDEAVKNSTLYDYLRDRGTDYDEAKDTLDTEFSEYMEQAAEEHPDMMDAYQTLPMFREWLVEDLRDRYYQDFSFDRRDSVAQHAGEPDAPEWIKNAPAETKESAAPEQGNRVDGSSTIREIYEQYLPLIQSMVLEDTAYKNACQNSDREGAYLEGNEAVKRAILSLNPAGHPDFINTYYGLNPFHNRLHQEILDHTYLVLSRPQAVENREESLPAVTPSEEPDARESTDADAPESDTSIPDEPNLTPHVEDIPIGMELTIDGRRMKIDSVDFETGDVTLQDMELKGWYPIFRSEKIPFVHRYVEEAQERENSRLTVEQPIPAGRNEPEQITLDGGQIPLPPSRQWERRAAEQEVSGRAFPGEIILQPLRTGPEKHNFHITDDNLGVGGDKTKYQYNVAAIRTLKQIEAEGRLASPEEQETLSRYVGWGGIAQAFDPDNPKWATEYAELKELLSPEEYASARSTTLNAHYTSPTVISAIYQAVGNMGFQPGTVLEPSMGIGNFFGLLPENLSAAKLYGVELDSLTGRIAKQLYQKADITVDGFEHTHYPDDFFDLAVGNVPFGEYKVHDPQYDRQNLLIHDYFFVKTLDKVRPGGIMAFITSKGTMDKGNPKVRTALAQKADLLGAIRLPNNAFKANAGTEVTTDILFFQKRDHAPEKLPGWVEVGKTEDGVPLNRYFLEHPEMVLGKMEFWKNMYGNETETACLPIDGANLREQLAEAVPKLSPPDRELLETVPEQEDGESVETIPADPAVRNYSYTEQHGKLYFRENSQMVRMQPGKVQSERIKGMIAIRDSARKLIDLQMENAGDGEIEAEQATLNRLYDAYTTKYGILSSTGNKLAFEQDSSYPLLCSLEVLDEEGRLERKADMFYKRTIQVHRAVTHVDTAVEALAVSIGEKACVDLGYMASLMGGSDQIPKIVEDLQGIIFKDPATGPFDIETEGANWFRGWQTADEYLSGNVRQKLAEARIAAEQYPEFAVNVEKLQQVQPKELTASEISVRIGSSWVDREYYEQFMFELLGTPERLQGWHIGLHYSPASGEWNVQGKSRDSSVRTHTTYGTKRINAYTIFENTLNQRDVRVFDVRHEDGKEVRVLNTKETMIAQQKQEAMCEAFKDWIWQDPERREALCRKYNEMFNSTWPREYDGSHIQFAGMTPEIGLRPHQQNAVAHILYGKNTLLAHCVGAGKTFEMVASAMESKRLGLCRKSLMVVPNHLTEQWGGDFLRLYPGAKVLVATKKDFEPARRKRFCARIATGDYDAVIIGHTQFEKLPLSPERQRAVIQEQIEEITDAILESKANEGERYTIKQLEKTKKNLEAKLTKLAAEAKKDNVVTFEQLGVDRLFVDEAHGFKNLFLHTKMHNVAGIGQTDAQKSSDMFGKCRYMDELTGGCGITFATGTPISNSMVELYTMMRYLQFDTLEKNGHRHFDAWAADFGEKVTAMELKPEGYTFSRR